MARNVRWDNYKAVLALLMVYGHLFRRTIDSFPILGGLFVFIYLFHMPAFLFVSGMFSKRAIEKRDTGRLISLFLQYILVKVAVYGSQSLIEGELIKVNLLNDAGVPWFALSVLECTLLVMLLEKFDRRYVFFASIVIGCLAGYFTDLGSFLSLSRTIVYFPYFYLGYCLQSTQVEQIADRKGAKWISGVFLAAVFAVLTVKAERVYEFRNFIKAKSAYYHYADIMGNAAFGGVYRLLLYVLGFAMLLAVFTLVPKRRIPVLSGVGSRTLSVYAFHYVFVNLTGIGGWLQVFVLSVSGNALSAALLYLAVSVVVLLISSAPPLEHFARWVTKVPLRKEPVPAVSGADGPQTGKKPE